MFKVYIILFLLIICQLSFSQCPDGYVLKDTNLVFNGDFSYGNVGFTTDYEYRRKYHWTNPQPRLGARGMYTVVHNANYILEPFAECLSPKGDHNPMWAGDGSLKQDNIWQQNVKVKPNTFYYYEANFSAVCCWDGVMTEFAFFANEEELDLLASEDTCDWKHFASLWNSGKSKLANLEIQNAETEGFGNDFVLDDIKLRECVKPEDLVKKKRVVIKEKIDYDDDSYALVDPKNQIRVNGVQFVPNKPVLKESSFQFLDAIVDHLKKIKAMNVEFLVHNGVRERTKIQERKLSQMRANLIKNYLSKKGITQERVKATGMGYTKPLRKDMRKESIQLNERVMVRFFVNENNKVK